MTIGNRKTTTIYIRLENPQKMIKYKQNENRLYYKSIVTY